MTDDLRALIFEAVARQMIGILDADECTDVTDALMPVIREALAEADDAGWDAAVHHLTNGDAIIFRPADHPNPWRGEA